MPVGGLVQGVPPDEHRARVFALIKTEQEIGEAQDSSSALVAGAANGFWQGVIGAVSKRVAVNDEKRLSHALPAKGAETPTICCPG